jgi:hypothetical protein
LLIPIATWASVISRLLIFSDTLLLFFSRKKDRILTAIHSIFRECAVAGGQLCWIFIRMMNPAWIRQADFLDGQLWQSRLSTQLANHSHNDYDLENKFSHLLLPFVLRPLHSDQL